MEKFSFDTIKDFDSHIDNSITGYGVLHNLIVNISEFFIQKSCQMPVLDIGCTSGKLLIALKDRYPELKCIGYDKTDHNFIQTDKVFLKKEDVTQIKSLPEAQIIFSVFTLQFIPFPYRQSVLKKIYDSLTDNGVFFFCEKEYATTAKFQEVFTFSNYTNKRKFFSSDEILNKEQDIRSLMQPLTSRQNLQLLKKVGFSQIEPFFKSLNFTGYLIQK